MLKLYVAGHPLEFSLSAAAAPHAEYSFATGDRVDVMFENHGQVRQRRRPPDKRAPTAGSC